MMFVFRKQKDFFKPEGYHKKFLWLPTIVNYDDAIVFAWLEFVWTKVTYKGLKHGYVREYCFLLKEKNK